MKLKNWLYSAAVLLGILWACTADKPTVPDAVVVQPTVPVTQEATPTIVTAPQPGPDSGLPVWVTCNKATGVCTFTSDRLRPVGAVCTYPGKNHPIWGTWNAVIQTGDTVNAVDICTDVPGVDEERCAPITKPVQIDFHGAGRHIGHLGPIYNLTFPATLSPEECEECVEFERPVITRVFTPTGDWSECVETPNRPAACKRWRWGTLEITRTWNCKEPEVARREHRESEPCECGPVCNTAFGFNKLTGDECPVCLPPEEITISWEGPGDPETECAAFGDYVPAGDHNPLFWICKAGTDREAWLTFPDGDTCRNGSDVSHIRACICENED